MTIIPGDPPPDFDGNDPRWVGYFDDEGTSRVGLKSDIDPDSGGGSGDGLAEDGNPIMPWTLAGRDDGSWNVADDYIVGTLVVNNANDGQTYVALTHNIGTEPSVSPDDWHVVTGASDDPVIIRGSGDPNEIGFTPGNPTDQDTNALYTFTDFSAAWINTGSPGNNGWVEIGDLFHGTADPTTGGGVAHNGSADPASIYIQTDGGTGVIGVWQSTGPGNTDWGTLGNDAIVTSPDSGPPINDVPAVAIIAPLGSLYMWQNSDGNVGALYIQDSAGDYDTWTEVGDGGGGSTPAYQEVDLSGVDNDFLSQSGTTFILDSGSILATTKTATDNPDRAIVSFNCTIRLTDGTSGSGGAGIRIQFENLLAHVSGLDNPYAPPSLGLLWGGVLAGIVTAGFMDPNFDTWTLCGFGGIEVTDAPISGDSIEFGATWIMVNDP